MILQLLLFLFEFHIIITFNNKTVRKDKRRKSGAWASILHLSEKNLRNISRIQTLTSK